MRCNKETELWNSFVDGDKSAFTVLYKQTYPHLYSYGVSLGIDDELLRDIIQEIFIKLYTRPQLVKNSTTLQSFMIVSVRNAFLNQLKQQKKHLEYAEIDNFELHYSIEETGLEEEEEMRYMKEKVERIIDSLTPRQKEIVHLRFLHQMEYEEIAEIMNMSEQAARNLTYRALEKIRKENPDPIMWCLILLFI